MKALIAALMLVSVPALAKDTFQAKWILSVGDQSMVIPNKDAYFDSGNFHCEINSASSSTNGVISSTARTLACKSHTNLAVTGAECRSFSKTSIIKLPAITINGKELSLDCIVE